MDDKRIKLINKKLFLCLLIATSFYIAGVASIITSGQGNPFFSRLFIIALISLIIGIFLSKFFKGYFAAFIVGTCFIILTLATAIVFNSCVIFVYLTILFAVIPIYQNIYLMTYIFLTSFIATCIGEVVGITQLKWEMNEYTLVPFVLVANVLGVILCYLQIRKDNQIKYQEIQTKQEEIENTYQNMINISKIVSENASQLVEKATSNRNDTQLVLNNINEITNALGNQTESISTQANSSNLIQNKLEEVQNCIYEMNTYVDSALNVTAKNEQSMLKLIANTDSVSKISQNSQNSISQLVQQVTDVQSVVDIITSVAEQTSLLSLNANIEAAKAGALGTGFTVVAAEIRKLSDSTTDSVQKINNMLISLLDKTEKVNYEILQMNDAFNKQKEEIQQTDNNMNELVNSMNILRNGLSKVITSTDDVVTSNTTVTESISNLSSLSQEISASLETINSACEGVFVLSNDTLDIAKNVDVKVKELSQ